MPGDLISGPAVGQGEARDCMDRKFLNYYNIELQHLRESSGKFSRENPKIAARLGLDRFNCEDPYVERLLEGFAFMAARVHLKLDEEFPRFTHSIINTVYPQYMIPTPSMAMVSFTPESSDPDLAAGFTIPADTTLKSVIGKGERTACQFQTAHEVTLYPLKLSKAVYQTGYRDTMGFGSGVKAAASLVLSISSPKSIPLNQIDLDALSIYIRDTKDSVPMQIYEQVFANCKAVVFQSAGGDKDLRIVRRDIENVLVQDGFAKEQALFPYDPRTFQGYRIIREYFAFPQRFMFFKLLDLKNMLAQCNDNKIEIILVFDKAESSLDKKINLDNFELFATPAINLFKKRTDRIHIKKNAFEFPVIADRTRTLDYEVVQIEKVTGYGADFISGKTFRPFYAKTGVDDDLVTAGDYYAEYRRSRSLTENEKRYGTRSNYNGSDMYISLVDEQARPLESDVKELSATALVSNRDLPFFMPVGKTATDFTLEINIPATAVQCVDGPTEPIASFKEKNSEWNIINHLSLNYLSILRRSNDGSTEILKDILKLYCDPDSYYFRRQIEGIVDIVVTPVTSRLYGNGPVSFVRGLEINLTLDEDAFRGMGIFLLGSILDRYFGANARINSFTQTVIHSVERGKIKRWPKRSGNQELN